MTGLPLYDAGAGEHWDALLAHDGVRLELVPRGDDAPGPIAVDFGSGEMRYRRRSGHNEALGRSVGVGKWSPLKVVDATAGLGRDAFVLADLGCRVTLLERSPTVFALLQDGLARAANGDDPWLRDVGSRLELCFVDAADWLADRESGDVDVVYLDPMFPARRKSARVKKEMWLFQQLLAEAPCGPLLDLATRVAHRRVVVKRPVKAPPLEARDPNFVIPGRNIRFDVYLPS